MAAKPPAKKKGRRRRKMRLTLKQKKMDATADSYTDSLGWSTDVGRTLADAPKEAEPEFINVQCEMCGSMMKARKPRKPATRSPAITRPAATPWTSAEVETCGPCSRCCLPR